jgi:hypothetical protein
MSQTERFVRWFGVVVGIVLLTGCASVSMQKTTLVKEPVADTALVTFVRPAVFLGDGVSINVWDGERFVGSLKAGTLIQYSAKPGEHLFLASAENWSYTTANLLPGKRYFIKANMFPGVLYGRVALAPVPRTDSRIEEWLSRLDPMTALEADLRTVQSEKRDDVRDAVMDFKAGKVSSFGELKPDDGL